MCSNYRLGTELGRCRTSDEKVHVTGAHTGQHKTDIMAVSQRRPSLIKRSARCSEPSQIHMPGFKQPKKFALLLGHHEVKLWTVQNVPWVSDMQTGLSAGSCDASLARKDFDNNPVSHEDRLLQRQDTMFIGPRARIAWLVVGANPSAAEQSAGKTLPDHSSACFPVEKPWRGSSARKHTVGHHAVSDVQLCICRGPRPCRRSSSNTLLRASLRH